MPCAVSCPASRGATCSGRGDCIDLRQAALRASPEVHYNTRWDHDMVLGCDCPDGALGFDCSRFSCPRTVDPEVIAAGAAVREVQRLTCQCDGACAGQTQISWGGRSTEALFPTTVLFEAMEDFSGGHALGQGPSQSLQAQLRDQLQLPIVGFTVSHSGLAPAAPFTLCTDSSTTHVDLTFKLSAGDAPDVLIAPGLTDTDGGDVLTRATTTDGTPAVECGGRGTCHHEDGSCICTAGYTGSDGDGASGALQDCGFRSGAPACPTNISGLACNGHGTCSGPPAYTCTCSTGWEGPACAHRACPVGTAWWDVPTGPTSAHAPAVCSGRGNCNHETGTCMCQHGFEGHACQRKSCLMKDFRPCSGRGQCLSLASILQAGTVQNSRPGAPARQEFFCQLSGAPGSSNSFSLLFFYQLTKPVPASGSAVDLRDTLESLLPAGHVHVSTSAADGSLCDEAAAVRIRVTFLDAPGSLPALQVVDILNSFGTGPGMGATSGGLATSDFTATVMDAGSLVQYGRATDASLVQDMWDADMLQGCLCDAYPAEGQESDSGDRGKFKGPNCELRTCPTGADPHQGIPDHGCKGIECSLKPENVTVTCEASGGEVAFSFRGANSAPVPFNAAPSTLKAALEAMPTISQVAVEQLLGTTLCTGASPATVRVTIQDPPGDLPMLRVDTEDLTSTTFSVSEVRQKWQCRLSTLPFLPIAGVSRGWHREAD